MLNQTFKGTANEFEAKNVHINGVQVSKANISVLSRYGLIKTVGVAPKPEKQRGKAAYIYEVTSGNIDFKVTAEV